jgi:hypothetical protein
MVEEINDTDMKNMTESTGLRIKDKKHLEEKQTDVSV